MLAWLAAALAADPTGDAERGAWFAEVAACPACHTVPAADAPALGGGYAIETKFGTFYGPNLTPDPTHGLGSWAFSDFVRAMRDGRSPDGHRYYPAFPYPSFAAITDADLADLWAWIQATPPSATPDIPHAPKPGVRGQFALSLWQGLTRWDRALRATGDATLDRGAYLGRHVAHCGECHTPRDGLGRMRRHREHRGNAQPPAPAPDITASGLNGWSEADLVWFLETGMTPDGDATGGEMARVVRDGTARLSADDRAALARWVLSIPGARRAAGDAEKPAEDDW